MEVAVWDTYVTRKDGSLMHFDIIAPASQKEESEIYRYGREYLKQTEQEGQPLSAAECSLCHIETASPEMLDSIHRQGYFILEIAGCR